MKDLPFQKAVILGATGPTGIFLARSLRGHVKELHMTSRSEENLRNCFPQIDPTRLRTCDVLQPGQVKEALDGSALVLNCVGFPSQHIDKHPRAARNIAEAIKDTSTRCIHVSSYWSYLPLVSVPVSETHPRRNGSEWMRYRREAEDILQNAGAAVVHLPDFFGPFVHTSTIQNPIKEAVEGKGKVNWIGKGDVERDYIFVPDAAATITHLAQLPEAFGERWILRGSGPLTGHQLVRSLTKLLERSVGLRCAGTTMLRIITLFKRDLRPFLQMVPEYVKPIAYDASKLETKLGELKTTGYEEALSQTVEWLRQTGSTV